MTESTPEPTAPRRSSLLGILALVAAVLGAALSWTGWGFALPIVAIVLALISRRRERSPKRLWVPALVIGILALVVCAISLFLQYLELMAAIGFSAG